MPSANYRVELDIFCGPLDLLLYLVRRSEVDILDLPIARIAAQFIDFLQVLEQIDLDLVGDFVVMASTLVEIKSRLVLPQPEEEQPAETPISEEDPRSELIQQLLEYKKFKEAATALETRAEQWQERYPRLSNERPQTAKDPSADRIKEVELWDLVSALGRVLRRKDVEDEARIRYDDTPIQVYVQQIGGRVREEGEVRFFTLFDAETIRSKIVGMFLAVLELLRHHGFRAEQPENFGDIIIRPPLEDAEQPSEPPKLELPSLEQLQGGIAAETDRQADQE
ncbi:Segregation and condensation protein A [Maioricimonas rarisocia]|uniref:Segregation and condensation protein A n=1 Tax=Maioricimonas rarisocia TaxID=2528026 RepID=A0A517Z5P6_9PLAN|nr:segregation/condensation protein A [Maioricimonas rarisocia]QDU37769.1 Segregation and condensation protein A [Maioricimonas rarisocia]